MRPCSVSGVPPSSPGGPLFARPQRSVRLWTDQACAVGSRSVSLATPKLSTQTSLTTSVRTQDLKRVMVVSLFLPSPRWEEDTKLPGDGVTPFAGSCLLAAPGRL